jgi:hypothetical protein
MTPTYDPPWRQGRKVKRNIYDANDQPIAMMPDEATAALVVSSVNRKAGVPMCIHDVPLDKPCVHCRADEFAPPVAEPTGADAQTPGSAGGSEATNTNVSQPPAGTKHIMTQAALSEATARISELTRERDALAAERDALAERLTEFRTKMAAYVAECSGQEDCKPEATAASVFLHWLDRMVGGGDLNSAAEPAPTHNPPAR